jgi:factor associated with neutral sphingomyelinase activation
MVFSVSHDKSLKVHQINDWELLRSYSISNLPLSSISLFPDSKTVIVGSWDNYMYLYSVEFAAVINSCYSHDSSVTCLCWKHDKVATGSWDSTVKIWSLPFNESSSKPVPPEIISELDHDNEVTALDLNNDVTLAVTGVSDGYVAVWNIEHEAKEFEIKAHSSDVLAIVFSPDGNVVCTSGNDGLVKIIDVNGRNEIICTRTDEPYWSDIISSFHHYYHLYN